MPTVPITPTWPDRVASHERPYARLDHADHRHRAAPPASSSSAAAAAVLQATMTTLDVVVRDQVPGDLAGEPAHLVEGFGPYGYRPVSPT